MPFLIAVFLKQSYSSWSILLFPFRITHHQTIWCITHTQPNYIFNAFDIFQGLTQISPNRHLMIKSCKLRFQWHVWKSKAWSVVPWFRCRVDQIISWNWKTDLQVVLVNKKVPSVDLILHQNLILVEVYWKSVVLIRRH